jgi:hypothetical protein
VSGLPQSKKRLGDLLLEEGLIDQHQLQSALAAQQQWGGRLGRHLLDMGFVSEHVLVQALARLLRIPSVQVSQVSIPQAVLAAVPVKTAERFNLIPLSLVEPGPDGPPRRTLVVAMSDPTNLTALDEVQFSSGCEVRPVVSGDGAIQHAIRVHYYGERVEPEATPIQMQDSMGDTGEHWEIMTSGDVRTLPKETSANPVPAEPVAPNLPIQQPPRADELPVRNDAETRRWTALLRLLMRKGVLTPEELAELEKL